MFRGVHNRIKLTPWNYAQYEKYVLESALYLVKAIGEVCMIPQSIIFITGIIPKN